MNRSDFLNLVEGPGPFNHTELGELSSLISAFPYFQSAYMLLLKGMQNTADVKFENQLRSSAMRIASREVLYYFLKKEPVEVAHTSEAAIHADNPPEIINKEDDRIDTQQVVIENALNSADFIHGIEKDEGKPESDNKPKGYSIIITDESGDKETDASLIVINEESGEVEERIVFMDPGFSVPVKEDLLELDTEHDKISEWAESDIHDEIRHVQEPVSAKKLQADLIEKFIIANPRIETVKAKADIPLIDISKPFVEEKEEFLTETLARIYVKQGYFSKAIDIYERLSLKYPEKSSYFASLILEVKELIKK